MKVSAGLELFKLMTRVDTSRVSNISWYEVRKELGTNVTSHRASWPAELL